MALILDIKNRTVHAKLSDRPTSFDAITREAEKSLSIVRAIENDPMVKAMREVDSAMALYERGLGAGSLAQTKRLMEDFGQAAAIKAQLDVAERQKQMLGYAVGGTALQDYQEALTGRKWFDEQHREIAARVNQADELRRIAEESRGIRQGATISEAIRDASDQFACADAAFETARTSGNEPSTVGSIPVLRIQELPASPIRETNRRLENVEVHAAESKAALMELGKSVNSLGKVALEMRIDSDTEAKRTRLTSRCALAVAVVACVLQGIAVLQEWLVSKPSLEAKVAVLAERHAAIEREAAQLRGDNSRLASQLELVAKERQSNAMVGTRQGKQPK
jgi:hypothetical protein